MMKKFTKLWCGGILLFSWMLLGIQNVYGQVSTVTTTTSFSVNNGSGLTTFNFQNSNPYPIIIDTVYSQVYSGSGSSTFYLWYNLTPVNGTPSGAIPTTTGWIAVDTEVVNISSGSIHPVLTNVGLVIPANTTVGMAVGGFIGVNGTSSGSMGYYSIPSSSGTVTFTTNGCSIIAGTNVSYGATSYNSTPTFYPRGFVGSISFEKQGVPDNAGIDSLLTPNPDSSFCSGEQEIKVRLRNFGLNSLDSVRIYWSLDGQQYGPLLYNTHVDSMSSPDNWAIVSLGTYDFPFNVDRSLKVWTSMPNGTPDNQVENDTLSSTIRSDMQNVTANIVPGDTAICQGTSIILDAGNQPDGVIFIWSNGALTQQTAVDEAGVYDVMVQSAQGCIAYDTVTITVNPQPIAGTFGVVDIGGSNFQFTPSGMQYVTNYHWNFGDGNSLNASYPVMEGHHYAQSGTYAVSLTVSNSCDSITLNKQVFVQPTTGINELAGQEGFIRIFPNPATNQVTIQAKGERKLERVAIYNLLGQKIKMVNINDAKSYQLDVTGLASGSYNLMIYTDKGQVVRKLNVLK